MHGFAAGTYPFLKSVPPQQFAKALSTTEIVLGAALLTPFVPTAVAGAALTALLRWTPRALPEDAGHAEARQPGPHRGRVSRSPRTAGSSASASACSPVA